jgi:hypothetical protein
LPADAVRELDFMANALERDAKTWSPRNASANMKKWLQGVQRGLRDAAASCRRRAGRIRLAMQRQQAKRDAAELERLRRVLGKRRA